MSYTTQSKGSQRIPARSVEMQRSGVCQDNRSGRHTVDAMDAVSLLIRLAFLCFYFSCPFLYKKLCILLTIPSFSSSLYSKLPTKLQFFFNFVPSRSTPWTLIQLLDHPPYGTVAQPRQRSS